MLKLTKSQITKSISSSEVECVELCNGFKSISRHKKFEIISQTRAMEPEQRDRTIVGIGEEIFLRTSTSEPVFWEYEHYPLDSNFPTTENGPFISNWRFQAPGRSGAFSIVASNSSYAVSKDFQVICPASIELRPLPNADVRRQIVVGANRTFVRLSLNLVPYFGPDTVSFYNCEYWEGDSIPSDTTVSGFMSSATIESHYSMFHHFGQRSEDMARNPPRTEPLAGSAAGNVILESPEEFRARPGDWVRLGFSVDPGLGTRPRDRSQLDNVASAITNDRRV